MRQQSLHFLQLLLELWGVVRRWILQLLKELIDGPSYFAFVGYLGIRGVSDKEGIERHGSLLCGSFPAVGYRLGIAGNREHDARSETGIVALRHDLL